MEQQKQAFILSYLPTFSPCQRRPQPAGEEDFAGISRKLGRLNQMFGGIGVSKLEICLVRHADAVDADGRQIPNDFQRPLSDKGETQAKLVGKALAAIGWKPHLLLHSPLVRTAQTAGLMAKGAHKLDVSWREESFAPLASGMGSGAVLEALRKRGDSGRLILVGHMPEMAEVAAWLLGTEPEAVHFPKAGAMLLSCPLGIQQGMARMEWFTNPEWHELAD